MAVQAHFLSALCLLQVCPSIYHSRRDAARATVVSGIILGHGSGVLASLRQTDIHPHARGVAGAFFRARDLGLAHRSVAEAVLAVRAGAVSVALAVVLARLALERGDIALAQTGRRRRLTAHWRKSAGLFV